MKKVSKSTQRMEATYGKPTMTVGLDMRDQFGHYYLLNEDGDVVEEGRTQSTEAPHQAPSLNRLTSSAYRSPR